MTQTSRNRKAGRMSQLLSCSQQVPEPLAERVGEAGEGDRRLDEHRLPDREGRRHEHGGERVREEVTEEDAPLARPLSTGGEDELGVGETAELRAATARARSEDRPRGEMTGGLVAATAASATRTGERAPLDGAQEEPVERPAR
jgi:hypothetical protein